MENLVGADGFAVGGKLSLSDVQLFNAFADTLPAETHASLPAYRREPFGDSKRVAAALAKAPKIAACIASVANNAHVQKWHSIRGVQGF